MPTATAPGKPPPCTNAGRRFPPEVLTDAEARTLMDACGEGCVMRVRSLKTERHPGHEQRIVPIVPGLMELIEARRAECPKGENRLVTIRSAGGRRRKMVAITKAAGVEPWDDTWQTLRRSCEVQWMNEGYAAYVVCRWLGHTISVSARHYTIAIPDEMLVRVTGRERSTKASSSRRPSVRIA